MQRVLLVACAALAVVPAGRAWTWPVEGPVLRPFEIGKALPARLRAAKGLPVELHVDMATRSIPLDATLVKGSHGAPARDESQRGVILASQPGVLDSGTLVDTDVFGIVLRQFGI